MLHLEVRAGSEYGAFVSDAFLAAGPASAINDTSSLQVLKATAQAQVHGGGRFSEESILIDAKLGESVHSKVGFHVYETEGRVPAVSFRLEFDRPGVDLDENIRVGLSTDSHDGGRALFVDWLGPLQIGEGFITGRVVMEGSSQAGPIDELHFIVRL